MLVGIALLVFAAALVLHPYPQLVHFREIEEQEVEGITDVPAIPLVL